MIFGKSNRDEAVPTEDSLKEWNKIEIVHRLLNISQKELRRKCQDDMFVDKFTELLAEAHREIQRLEKENEQLTSQVREEESK